MAAITNKNLHSREREPTYSTIAFAPVELARSAVKTAYAYFSHDQEALIDGMGKVSYSLDLLISGASVFFRGLIFLGVWLEDDVLKALPHFFQMIVLPYAIIGLVVSSFIFVYESIIMLRGYKLRCRLNFSDQEENFKNNQALIRNEFFTLNQNDKARIENYLTEKFSGPEQEDLKDHVRAKLETKILTMKFESLCRRVSEPAAIQISNIINSDDAADLKTLTEILDIQTNKTLITHAFALISVILSMVCYGLLLATFPHVMYVSLALALASVIFFFIYYALEKGFLDRPGYSFSISACIPNWVKRIFSPGIAVREVPHPLSSREIQLLDMPLHATLNHH